MYYKILSGQNNNSIADSLSLFVVLFVSSIILIRVGPVLHIKLYII